MATPTRTPAVVSSTQQSKIKEESEAYLRSLINKNLRVTTTDNRMFWGAFKCTDYESNIVLQHTYEYRFPEVTPESLAAAAQQQEQGSEPGQQQQQKKTIKLDMTSRYLGLVVVPGKYILRIEVEEFASQMRGAQRRALMKSATGVDGSSSGGTGGKSALTGVSADGEDGGGGSATLGATGIEVKAS